MVKNNAPCICSHSNINHVNQQFYMRNNSRFIDTRKACAVKGCECVEFKLDNLKFLEREDESRQ